MRIRQTIAIVIIAAAAGAGAFAATRAARVPRDSTAAPATAPVASTDPTQVLMEWLAIAPAKRSQIAAQDPSFPADLQKLRDELTSRRSALADALQDPKAPDELISSRVEGVIAASNALERRITRYLLAVRPDLTADQQRRLFGLCAEGVRQGNAWCSRRGAGAADSAGPGPGRGMGRGGPRYRGGR